MRRTARGLGHHSQNSANASRAVVKGSSAHRRTMSTITPRLKLRISRDRERTNRVIVNTRIG